MLICSFTVIESKIMQQSEIKKLAQLAREIRTNSIKAKND